MNLKITVKMVFCVCPRCVCSANGLKCCVFGEPVDYWPVVGKFAETLELSYLDTRHRLWEEAETLTAFAGLSVVSTTSSSQIDSIQCVYQSVHYIVYLGVSVKSVKT